jgi:hypothetical protein
MSVPFKPRSFKPFRLFPLRKRTADASLLATGCAEEQLSALNPQPSTLNPQPSTLNPQPSTLHPQLSSLNPRPSTLGPQSSSLNPQTSTQDVRRSTDAERSHDRSYDGRSNDAMVNELQDKFRVQPAPYVDVVGTTRSGFGLPNSPPLPVMRTLIAQKAVTNRV